MFILVSKKPEYQTICEQYWAYDRGFIYEPDAIARSHNIVPDLLLENVKKGCLAYYKDHICDGCADPLKLFQQREDFKLEKEKIAAAHARRERGLLNLCAECAAGTPLNYHYLSRSQIIGPATTYEMDEACKQSVYESLSLLQFNFLKNLCISKNYLEACKISGLHPKKGRQLISTLADLNLLSLEQEGQTYYILPVLMDACKKALPKKTIFGSQKAEQLFRLLKSDHYHVFPEIHLSSFIDYEQIKHVFKQAWEEKYFHFSRVDFLACDRNGIPVLAAEYDGGYHAVDSKQQQKDALKENILLAAGLEIVRYTEKDLRQHEQKNY